MEGPAERTRSRFRFSPRMVVALSMVAAAVWLFIRYIGPPGILFAITMLLAGWCVVRANKAGVVGYLAVFAVAWLALHFFGPYTSLRNRIVWVVGTERLQRWAVEVLENPPPQDNDGLVLLNRDSLPKDIRSIAGPYISVDISEDGTRDRIVLGHGGGFYHWGILVGPPGYTPLLPDQYDKIADGIWGFQGG